jgi:3-deoxy-7-phosphoheptulonate synthase
MLVIMKHNATDDEVAAVIQEVRRLGYDAHVVPGVTRKAIGVTGNELPLDPALVEELPGVAQTLRVTRPFRLVSRDTKTEDTIVDVSGVMIGGRELAVIAGPCAVESVEQIVNAAESVKAAGGSILRGGAFKPRTSPYSFQGLGERGLKMLTEARRITGLPVVSEIMDEESAGLAGKYVDMLQVGARNMQNYALLKLAARSGKPILLKRGAAATLEELLSAAEYILADGNSQVVLCERGVRGFSDFTRNTLDLSIIPAVKEVSHLPIITDPSHGTGRRSMVVPLARASIAAGADGVMVEMHPDPQHALSDGFQSLHPDQFGQLMHELEQIAPIVGRSLQRAT